MEALSGAVVVLPFRCFSACKRMNARILLLQTFIYFTISTEAISLAERETAFVGWSEKEIPGGFDERVLNEACVDDADRCEDWARKGECERNTEYMRTSCRKSCYVCEQYVKRSVHYGKNIVMSTEKGEVHVQLLWDKAPDMCHLMAELANGAQNEQCEFYRNEEAPTVDSGPPYGLLQGVCKSLQEAPPKEVTTSIQRGHVATIHPGKDFYIALIEHGDWSAGHTVWGFVDDLTVVDTLVALPYTTMKHATYGTEMRMLDEPAKFGLSLTPAAELAASHAIEQLR